MPSKIRGVARILIRFIERLRKKGPRERSLLYVRSFREARELRRVLGIERDVQTCALVGGHE